MASVPAQTTQSNVPAAPAGSRGEGRSRAFMGFNRLDLLRQIGLMVGLAASVALGVAVVLWAQEPNYQPVLGDLSSYNPQDVTSILDGSGIDYKMDPRTGALLVVADQVYNARLRLAAEGVTDQKPWALNCWTRTVVWAPPNIWKPSATAAAWKASWRVPLPACAACAAPECTLPFRSVRCSSAMPASRQPRCFWKCLPGAVRSRSTLPPLLIWWLASVPMMTQSGVTVVDQMAIC